MEKNIYTFRAKEEIAEILDILDRNEITAKELGAIFPNTEPSHGAVTEDSTFEETYKEIQSCLQSLQGKMIELAVLYFRKK